MSKKFIKLSIVLISLCVLFPLFVTAAPIFDEGQVIANNSTLPIEGTSPVARIVLIIQISLTFLGAITTIVLVYSGFLFAFSGGNPSTVDKARKTLTWALIGMLIVLASWAMTSFVKDNFNIMSEDGKNTSNQPTGPCECNGRLVGTLTQISCKDRCDSEQAKMEWKEMD